MSENRFGVMKYQNGIQTVFSRKKMKFFDIIVSKEEQTGATLRSRAYAENY